MTLHPLTHATALCTDRLDNGERCSFGELVALSALDVNLHHGDVEGLSIMTGEDLAALESFPTINSGDWS